MSVPGCSLTAAKAVDRLPMAAGSSRVRTKRRRSPTPQPVDLGASIDSEVDYCSDDVDQHRGGNCRLTASVTGE